MIVLGLILLIVGFIAHIAIAWTIGIIVLLIGVILLTAGLINLVWPEGPGRPMG